jgi:lipoprotein-anchoring transpeptidase ErfK/SrfK
MKVRIALVSLLLVATVLANGPAAASPARKHHRRRTAKAAHVTHGAPQKPQVVFRADEANDASITPLLSSKMAGSLVLRAQVLLDRAHFSPGEIDGFYGDSMVRATEAFNAARSLPGRENVTPETWAALNKDTRPVVASYVVTADDVAGPFIGKVPEKMEDKARLPAMSYESPEEELAERFHMGRNLLARLNPGTRVVQGAELHVLDVARPPIPPAASVRVSESDLSVSALDAQGNVLARYPATVGSEHDPLPVGDWKITGVGKNPVFHYNPDLFWDAKPRDSKVTVPAGPNNPVGVVWIDLSKPHYGIHGSPEPATIGKTTSHGCIRLTNWDAAELASLVVPGTPALLSK